VVDYLLQLFLLAVCLNWARYSPFKQATTNSFQLILWSTNMSLLHSMVWPIVQEASIELFLLFYVGGLGPVAFSHFGINLKLWNLHRAVRTPWTRNQPIAKPLSTQNNTNIERSRHTSILRVGFEHTTRVSERGNTLPALHHAPIVTGLFTFFFTLVYLLVLSNYMARNGRVINE
jgi:hypothetical protein